MSGLAFILIVVGLVVIVAGAVVALRTARDHRETIGRFRVDLTTDPAEVSFSSTVAEADLARLLVLLVHDTLRTAKWETRAFLWDALFRRYGGKADPPRRGAPVDGRMVLESPFVLVERMEMQGKPVLAGRICRRDELSYRLEYSWSGHPVTNPEGAVLAVHALISHYDRTSLPPPELSRALHAYMIVASGRGKLPPAGARVAALAVIEMGESAMRAHAEFVREMTDGEPKPRN